MEIIGPEVRVVCPWIRKFAIFGFDYIVASANIDQSVPNLATIYMTIRSGMSLIMGQIELEQPELFAFEFGKMTEPDFIYTLASTNINQSAPNLVRMYVTHKISDEFDYGVNQIRTVRVICPWICRNCWIWLFTI